ncbi:hypothetical protein LZ30DRAFT_466675 [Colletotrichum cereale]|nr:hypothetical protein LZ30DRAFT_466675 [Colletotrichum cereale]
MLLHASLPLTSSPNLLPAKPRFGKECPRGPSADPNSSRPLPSSCRACHSVRSFPVPDGPVHDSVFVQAGWMETWRRGDDLHSWRGIKMEMLPTAGFPVTTDLVVLQRCALTDRARNLSYRHTTYDTEHVFLHKRPKKRMRTRHRDWTSQTTECGISKKTTKPEQKKKT